MKFVVVIVVIALLGTGLFLWRTNSQDTEQAGAENKAPAESATAIVARNLAKDGASQGSLGAGGPDHGRILSQEERAELITSHAKMMLSRVDHQISGFGEFVHQDVEKNLKAFIEKKGVKSLLKSHLEEMLQESFDSVSTAEVEKKVKEVVKASVEDLHQIEAELAEKLGVPSMQGKVGSKLNRGGKQSGIAPSNVSIDVDKLVENVWKEVGDKIHGRLTEEAVVTGSSFALAMIVVNHPLYPQTLPTKTIGKRVVKGTAVYILSKLASGEPYEVVSGRIVREGAQEISKSVLDALRKELYSYGHELVKAHT